MKKGVKYLLSLILLIISVFSLAGCRKDDSGYNLTVISIGGQRLNDVEVSVYKNNKLVKSKTTNNRGVVKFDIDSGRYTVELDNLPDGCYYNEPFVLTEKKKDYTIEVLSFIADSSNVNLDDVNYELSDVIYDFTLTATSGETFNLASQFETYKAVMINFWHFGCTYCMQEFPYMAKAYNTYSDSFQIIGVNPYDSDIEEIEYYRTENEINFPMAYDTLGLAAAFGVTAFPTSVIVDRYGVIAHIENGAILAQDTFENLFKKFIGDDYYPITNDYGKEDVRIPNVDMPSSKTIEKTINNGITCTYVADTEESDVAYTWPWVLSEDKTAIQPSNSFINDTAASIMTNIEIPENKVLAFDYLISTEEHYDILYILIDGVIIHSLSGIENDWKTCFAYVSEKTKTYDVSLIYFKDGDSFEGNDTVLVKNMRMCDIEDINTPTYIYRYPGDNFTYLNYNYREYITPVFNGGDGYYHVNDANGPLILADLIYTTRWNPNSMYNYAANGYCVVNNVDYNNVIAKYAIYASNSTIGYTPVTQELYEALYNVAKYISGNDNENEWLDLCCYYSAYGTNGKQLVDPIKGLAPFSAYDAKIDEVNEATFTVPVVPRGFKFKFTPETSGVYKVYSLGDIETLAWIFNDQDEIIYEANFEARYFKEEQKQDDMANFEMYYYFEAGTTYYICVAFYDVVQMGTLKFEIDFVDTTYDLLTQCSPWYFTTDLDENGNIGQNIISGGIDVLYNEDDGYYHHLKSNNTMGSIIYADFSMLSLLGTSLANAITLGAFNFTIDASGNPIVDTDGNPVEGLEDLTGLAIKYRSKMINDGSELNGCVPVDLQLAELLQKIMDKYTFIGVENSWIKLCYYYNYLGK